MWPALKREIEFSGAQVARDAAKSAPGISERIPDDAFVLPAQLRIDEFVHQARRRQNVLCIRASRERDAGGRKNRAQLLEERKEQHDIADVPELDDEDPVYIVAPTLHRRTSMPGHAARSRGEKTRVQATKA